MATATKTPWGAVNAKNGGGLAKQLAPATDQRLLFAMYDVERAVQESEGCIDLSQFEAHVDRFVDNVDALTTETKALRESMDTLGKLLEKFSDSLFDVMEAKGGA